MTEFGKRPQFLARMNSLPRDGFLSSNLSWKFWVSVLAAVFPVAALAFVHQRHAPQVDAAAIPARHVEYDFYGNQRGRGTNATGSFCVGGAALDDLLKRTDEVIAICDKMRGTGPEVEKCLGIVNSMQNDYSAKEAICRNEGEPGWRSR